MKAPNGRPGGQRGFSLMEMMTALVIFLLISAVAFSLLGVAQKRYATESEVLNAFQEARLGLDQIVRDVNDAGYPPRNQFTFGLATPPANIYASSPVAWTPNYPSTPCQVGITCGITPTGTDIIIETYVSAQGCPNNGVSWIRYQLVGTTLNRGITCKSSTDPDAATSAAGIMAPYVQNVMNNASAAQIAQFQTYYPSMFPSGAPVPVFTYICDTQSGLAQDCSTASATDNSPRNVRAVGITLIVMAPVPDAQTGAPRLVELNGRGRRVNPNQ
jgi:prepilin-type N-terminal cleavage/methylation domain-containing protein